MTRFAAAALIVLALSIAPFIHNHSAQAADFPALPDGGSRIGDGGVIDLSIRGRSGWQAAITCEGAQRTRYVFCETSTCAASTSHQLIIYDKTMDVGVPAGHRYLAVAQEDSGFPTCTIMYVQPRTLPE